MRIDKYLSEAAVASRSESAKAIRAGAVTVNGVTVKSPAEHIDETTASVVFRGVPVVWRRFTYAMLNKPAGVVSTTDDTPRAVMKILPPEFTKMGMFPCGRLDIDTVGLLLITNDGALAHELLSPRHHVAKRYGFRCDPPISQADRAAIEAGIDIGGYITKPASIELEDGGASGVISITEGKFHQIKRMFEAVGSKIVYLRRLSFGSLVLDENLAEGKWRYLTDSEISALRAWAGSK